MPNGVHGPLLVFFTTFVKCVKTDIKILGGGQQLGKCQKEGIEHFIQSLRAALNNTNSEAILLINPKNAFNSPKRDHALSNTE